MAILFEGHKKHFIIDSEADINSGWEIGCKVTCVNSGKNYTMMAGGIYISEGYTDTQAVAAALAGALTSALSIGTNSAITSTDTILSALGKLQAQITALIGKMVRTTSSLTGISIVTSTSGGGIQISATKDSSLHLSIADSITTSVGGTSTETLIVEICPTNSVIASDWVEAQRTGDSQSITLAIALQTVQPGYRILSFDLPAGNYFRIREVSAGTHSGSIVSGQKTLYG